MANGINAFAIIALMAVVALAGSQGQARVAAPVDFVTEQPAAD